jgi:hypothetical protein
MGAVCAGLTAPASAGCTTHQCDAAPNINWTSGDAIDDNTYETNPLYLLDGGSPPWVPFPHAQVVVLDFGPPFVCPGCPQRQIASTEVYIGTSSCDACSPNLGSNGDNWTQSSGNLAELFFASPGGLVIRNSTCADYVMRAVVHFDPVEGGAPVVLAEPVGDAATEDAADAGSD